MKKLNTILLVVITVLISVICFNSFHKEPENAITLSSVSDIFDNKKYQDYFKCMDSMSKIPHETDVVDHDAYMCGFVNGLSGR